MTIITEQEWTDNIGFYKFDKGYEGTITVCAEEHKVFKHSRISAQILVPDNLLQPNNSGNSYTINDVNPVKTQEEGRKRGEEYLLKLISDFEAGILTKHIQGISRDVSE